MTRTLTLVAALCLLTSSVGAQRPMTPDDVLTLRQVSSAQISPDGRWVAYVVSAVDLKANAANADLWLVSADGGEPFRLTTSAKGDNQPKWSPDGKWIGFLSSREERSQIWLIRPNGGEAERLTESKSGVQEFEWAPDGRTIAYRAPRELTADEERRQKEKDDPNVVDTDFRFSQVWTIDVASKKSEQVVKADYHVTDIQWSPDGTKLAYTANPTTKADDGGRSDIYVLTLASGASRVLHDNGGPDNGPRWSPDGRQIAFLTREDKPKSVGQLELVVVDAEGGSPRPVARGFLYQPGAPTWSTDGATLYFSSLVRTTTQLFSVPARGGSPRQLTSVEGTMSGPSFTADGRAIAYTYSDPQHPSEVYLVKDLAGFAPVKLTDHNPQLTEVALGRHEVVRWKSKDGMEIEGIVIYPVGYQPGRRYPTMAFIHGGPSGVWTQSFPGSWGNYGHVYAGNGWVSFYPNIRGSSGYGEKFLAANVRDWGGGDYQDVQSGLDHLVARGIADSARMGQAGWSYGGYMTAWTLTQTSRFKGVMVGAGLTNMYSMYSTNDLQTVLENYFGAEPWDDEEVYRRASAMMFIKQAKTPTLILHGQQDNRVPIGQAQELYMGLKKNDVPVTLVFYPREGHGLSEPRHQLDKMKREYAFFSKTVLGVEVKDPEPVP
ncbi:MAG: prolyl oligopeptidase family serine peptidase [Gemmatimonadales bacterium]